MTRINVVPVRMLDNDHLLAEYREITRVFTAVRKLVDAGLTPSDAGIPPSYVLGKGHVKFFYNKLGWILSRYEELYYELGDRYYSPDEKLFRSVTEAARAIPEVWHGRYEPSPKDFYLNMARLVVRCNVPLAIAELHRAIEEKDL